MVILVAFCVNLCYHYNAQKFLLRKGKSYEMHY